MKKSVVEWLIIQMHTHWTSEDVTFQTLLEQAKAMEKEQMIETWHNGYNNQSPMIDEENCGQHYYNETYKQD